MVMEVPSSLSSDRLNAGRNENRQAVPAFADILDGLASHIAILDPNGVIVYTNRAWRAFATANGMGQTADMVGINYLDVCGAAQGDDAPVARRSAAGIRAVMNGQRDEFLLDYPCHSATEQHWFHLRVTRFIKDALTYTIVAHENVTDLKLIQQRLEAKEQQLQRRATELEDANTALKVLLKQREQDRREMEEDVLANVRKRVFPYLKELRRGRLDERQEHTLALLESTLSDLTSPFIRNLNSAHSRLTPREIQVAHLVRDGHSSKEIADFLDLSPRAVEFHRANIRKKFALSERRLGLRSFLLTLDD